MPANFAETIQALPIAPPTGRCTTYQHFTLVVHGGAQSTEAPRKAELQWLAALLQQGHVLLAAGAEAIDVAVWVVWQLEDSGLFNAGNGAVPNSDGILERDAAIMDGRTRKAGAVASVVGIPHPITAARWVMDQTDMVLIAGPSAERMLGFEPASRTPPTSRTAASAPGKPFGTVGAVVLDRAGNLAAGTSTGGRVAKIAGRVGDTPIIGAGTWADNATAAISATGDGEYFMRTALAHDVHARMAYQGLSVAEAATRAMDELLVPSGGEGGLIAVGRNGDYAWPFHCKGMIRGAITERGEPVVAVA